MRRYAGSVIGIDQGNEEVFSDFDSGARERRKQVVFSEPFSEAPSVQVALSLWDMDQDANVRADIAAENVTETGFELVFRTWSDTRVARVRMSWIAIGAIPSDDDWQLY